jgi:uncharacterized protein YdhG (YjbR/CyaY superfamily)
MHLLLRGRDLGLREVAEIVGRAVTSLTIRLGAEQPRSGEASMTSRGQDAPPTSARSAEIDAFLAAYPEDVRAALQRLRRTIAGAAPEAVESINYGVPAFKYKGRPFVSFAAGKTGKSRCSFYVQSPTVMDAHRDELASYETSKGTVHFAPDAPPPDALVTRLVRARMAEIDAAGK